MPLLSNPCNPTGITKSGEELKDFVKRTSKAGHGVRALASRRDGGGV